jgi:ArsR family transcriptional regulator
MAVAVRSGLVDTDIRLLAALADPIRLDMLRQLASDGEVCGCGFHVLDRVAQPTVSHHLRVLRKAGLVHFERERSYLRYRLDPDALGRVAAIIDGLRLPPSGPGVGADVDGKAVTACCGAGRPQ